MHNLIELETTEGRIIISPSQVTLVENNGKNPEIIVGGNAWELEITYKEAKRKLMILKT